MRVSPRTRVRRLLGAAPFAQLAALSLVGLAAMLAFSSLGGAVQDNISGRASAQVRTIGARLPAVGGSARAASSWVRSAVKVLQRRHGPQTLVRNAQELAVAGEGIVRGVRRQYEVLGLPWWEHLQNKDPSRARRLQVVDRGARQIRYSVTDSPFSDDGSFTRSIEIENVLYDHVPRPQPPRVEDAPFIYSAKTMGPSYDPESGALKLRVFAPRHEASLVLHRAGPWADERIPMRMDHAGVWEVDLRRAPNALTGREYSFALKDRTNGEETLVSDPYGHGASEDVTRSRVVDLRYDWQSPSGPVASVENRVLFESHVRDLTRDPSSPLPDTLRGSYTGAADPVVGQMFRGGAPEFLPVHEYDEFFGGHWGYASTDFFAPTLRYAVDPSLHPRRVAPEQQLMELIDAHRTAGRPVVLDVVYNHTANDNRLYFFVAGEDLYYRIELDEAGKSRLRNGSGTGNEFASEHPMAQKLIVDSLMHFVEHYRVDGFRFDLGALIDIPTLRYIDKRLPKHVFLTMEPWSWQHARFGKDILNTPALKDTRWTVWNDDARDLFEHIHRHGVTNDLDLWSLQKVIAGSVAESPTAPGQKPGFTHRPNQTVNPVGTHDEAALTYRSTPQRVAMTATLGITSQGTPLLQPLMTAMHDKFGIGNTWNLDNATNWLNWEQRRAHQPLEEFVTALAEYRADRSHFRYDRPLNDKDIQWLRPDGQGIGFRLEPSDETGPQSSLLVLTNTSTDSNQLARYVLPEGDWKIAFDGETLEANPVGRGAVRGEYYVRPGTVVILEER